MTLLELDNVTKTFQRGSGPKVHAVRGISFSLNAGETLAIIGESGSGKSTAGRLAIGLLPVSGGEVRFEGTALGKLAPRELRALRPHMQAVFQEPFQSLNPRMRIIDIVEEPLIIHHKELSRRERRDKAFETLSHVGLPPEVAFVYPRVLSGGQQQRVGIARALVTQPKLVILDEPTSSLDLSVRAQILGLLKRLQDELQLAYLFISHDISTVEYMSDRVAVMHRGQFVEVGRADEVLINPKDDYTKALLSARLSVVPGELEPYIKPTS
jgi:ABC-type oligopeptide transport system ATPase subunit